MVEHDLVDIVPTGDNNVAISGPLLKSVFESKSHEFSLGQETLTTWWDGKGWHLAFSITYELLVDPDDRPCSV